LEDRPVSCVAKEQADVASRCPGYQDAIHRCARIRKGLVGVLLAVLHDPIQFVLNRESHGY
jgi:hypothetical protein